jgi:hypothetical protein
VNPGVCVQNMDLNRLYEPLLNDVDATKPSPGVRADIAGPGLRRDDKPFQPCLTLVDPQGMAGAIDSPLCSDALVNAAISALVANLISLVQLGEAEWLFYARDTTHYSKVRRYVPDFYRLRVMIEAVDRLQSAGLIEHQQTRPSPSARYRSRIRPTEALRASICEVPMAATYFNRRELVVLRGADGQPLPYRETSSVYAMRRDVTAHNAFLQGFDITLVHPEAHYDEHGYLVIDGHRLNPNRTSYHRIFNGCFTRGGRWYGPWWQSVPSRCRTGIRINGEPTCEPDIPGCHMRLLSARAGVKLGASDPYEGLDLPRKEVKLAINVMLNAPSWPRARAALIANLPDDDGSTVRARVDRLRTAIQRRFPALDPFWVTGYGLTLQRIDADICQRLQRRLRDRGVPVLSVHDSFVVPQSAREFTTGVMHEEFDRACDRLRAEKSEPTN